VENSLRNVVPEVDRFGFVARLATEVLTADGGNVSAAITSGSLALTSAGVPLSNQVGSSCQAIIAGETGHKLVSDPMVTRPPVLLGNKNKNKKG